MHLLIHIVGDSGLAEGNKNILKEFYLEGLRKHKQNLKTTHPDSGFDLFCPRDLTIPHGKTSFIDLGIQCAAYDSKTTSPKPFYVYPRSSLSKTPLRLANSVGIIDSGYRGNILAAVIILEINPFNLEEALVCFKYVHLICLLLLLSWLILWMKPCGARVVLDLRDNKITL